MTNDDDYMLTTFDNPINPFTNFEAWWKMDAIVLGHDCCGTLAREANTSPTFSDEINDKLILDAMDRICKAEPFIYKKVLASDYKTVAAS